MAAARFASLLRPPWPIARLLVLSVAVLALPLLALIAWEGFRVANVEKTQLNQQTVAIAERVTSAVDQTLQSYITILQTLATSPALKTNDLIALYYQARAAYGPAGLYASLSNPAGDELFNTRKPLGSLLPNTSGIDEPVLASKHPYVSGFVYCEVAKGPVVMVSVPVMKGDELVYVLSLSVDVARFKELLDREKLDPEWIVGIADEKGIIIARTHRNDEFLGKPIPNGQLAHYGDNLGWAPTLEGAPAIIARRQSKIAGWVVGALVPQSIANANISRALSWYASVVALVTSVGFVGAVYFGRMIVASFFQMQKAAEALGKGEEISFDTSFLKESRNVEAALVNSAAQRKEAENKLLQVTQRFMAAEEGAGGFVYDWDAVTDCGWRSNGFTRVLGWRLDEVPVTLEAWRQMIHPDDRKHFDQNAHQDSRGGMEMRVRHRDGHYLWMWDRGRFFRDEKGVVVRKVGTIIDITPRKTLEQQQALLSKELSHRYKNLLAVIQSVTRRTLASCSSTAEAKQALGQRLDALARTYETLTETPSYNAPITKIVADELSAFSSRANIEGAPLFLNPAAAQTMALIVHELATNAAKYGALSVSDGVVTVRWDADASEGNGRFHFSWAETGGPTVHSPNHRGFGSILTEEIAAMQFGGVVSREFREEGFRYELAAPISAIAAGVEPSVPMPS